MNVSQYEALLKALETGPLSQAAEELGYSQSGLTRALIMQTTRRSGLSCSTGPTNRLRSGSAAAVWILDSLNIRRTRKWIRNFCTGIPSSAFLPQTIPMQVRPAFR